MSCNILDHDDIRPDGDGGTYCRTCYKMDHCMTFADLIGRITPYLTPHITSKERVKGIILEYMAQWDDEDGGQHVVTPPKTDIFRWEDFAEITRDQPTRDLLVGIANAVVKKRMEQS